MKTINYISVAVLICLVIVKTSNAQDHHFSQYDATYQYLNPALTGMSWDETFEWRANTSYRSQWGALATKPFTNQLVAFDMPYKEFGVGGLIYNNRAGTGHLNTFNFMLSGAYEITIDPSNIHNLYGGLQLGILHRNLQVSELMFDSQYSYEDGTYDASIASGENIPDKSILRFDANMGFFYKYFDKTKDWSPHGGLSLYHGTKPNESFTSLKQRIPIRWMFSGGCDYKVNDMFIVTPGILFMYEAKATDFVIGSMGKYDIKDTDYKAVFGLSYRYKDAIIVHAGLQWQSLVFRMSYDLNVSYLRTYTHLKGGLEFSLVYYFYKQKDISRTLF